MSQQTHYQTLGLSPDATAAQIRAAYRRLAKQHHPDASKVAGAQQRFAAIAAAYEILSDRDRRRTYDAELATRRPPAAGIAGTPHYSWTNIATGQSGAPDEPSELDELYDTFFGASGRAEERANRGRRTG